jgi:hypothetical protein
MNDYFDKKMGELGTGNSKLTSLVSSSSTGARGSLPPKFILLRSLVLASSPVTKSFQSWLSSAYFWRKGSLTSRILLEIRMSWPRYPLLIFLCLGLGVIQFREVLLSHCIFGISTGVSDKVE